MATHVHLAPVHARKSRACAHPRARSRRRVRLGRLAFLLGQRCICRLLRRRKRVCVRAFRLLRTLHSLAFRARGCLGGLTPTRGGVVIGQGGDAQAVTMRCPHDVSWRVCPV